MLVKIELDLTPKFKITGSHGQFGTLTRAPKNSGTLTTLILIRPLANKESNSTESVTENVPKTVPKTKNRKTAKFRTKIFFQSVHFFLRFGTSFDFWILVRFLLRVLLRIT